MKATLTFNLPEEKHEHERAVHAMEAFSLLHEIDQHLRNVVKHNEGAYESPEALASHVREQIWELLQKVEE
jgi:uncharacterized protein (UPF0147 family)